MLEYDNSAFYYFAITLLAIYAVPATWYAVAELFRAFFSTGDIISQARTKEEREKAELIRKQTAGWARLCTAHYLLNLLGLVISWLLLAYLLSQVIRDGQVSSFDPFQILGVPQGAALAEIKKAYRALSLKFHPDKNIGDKNAEEMFMKVAKAYEALTDATSKENYEKYGNPDGKQALEVSIGLPKWLLENPKTVLVVYLLAMVIVIPAGVGLWYSNSKQFGDKNVLYDTYNAFYQVLNESHRARHLVEVLAVSAESRSVNGTFRDSSSAKTSDAPSAETQAAYDAVFEAMKKEKRMLKPKFERPEILRGNLLLHAHLNRQTQLLNKELQEKLQAVLKKTPELLEGLVEIAQMRKFFDTSLGVVALAQCVVQGLSPLHAAPTGAAESEIPIGTNNAPQSLLQLPHLAPRDVERVCATTASPTVSTLSDFLSLSDAEKLRRANIGGADSEAGKELLAACSAFPRLSVATEMFVEEDDDDDEDDGPREATGGGGQANEVRGDTILEQDLVTLRVTLTRENLVAPAQTATEAKRGKKEQKKAQKKKMPRAGPVYAPRFPGTLQEGWWLVLVDRHTSNGEPIVHAFEHVTGQEREVSHEIRFLAPPRAGEYSLELLVLSDCYMGLDQARKLDFEVRPASDLPEYTPHQEDLDLDNEPTLFEQLAANNLDEDSSDDEEDEEDDARVKPKKPAAAAGKAASGGGAKKAAVVVEDDDSEEEEDD